MFGQYSSGSGRHTKADQVEAFVASGYQVAQSKRMGHNRTLVTTEDGRKCFMLHKTVIAELSADGTKVTLRDGGWATMTTRRAMGDALAAFGLGNQSVWAAKGGHVLWGHRFDREATFDVATRSPAVDVAPCPYLVRSDTGNGEYASVEVTYDGREVSSTEFGKVASVKPAMLIAKLRAVLNGVRKSGRKVSPYWYRYREALPLNEPMSLFGHDVGTNGFGRVTYFGCHAFKTADLRALLRRLEADFPEAAAKSRKVDGAWKANGGQAK